MKLVKMYRQIYIYVQSVQNQVFFQYSLLLSLHLQAVVWEHMIWQLKCYSLEQKRLERSMDNGILGNCQEKKKWKIMYVVFLKQKITEANKIIHNHCWSLYGNYSASSFGLCSLSQSFSLPVVDKIPTWTGYISWPVTVNTVLRILQNNFFLFLANKIDLAAEIVENVHVKNNRHHY